MKKITLSFFLFFSIISSPLADDTVIIDMNTIKQKALAVSHKHNLDFFNMFDRDGDGNLSETECRASLDNIEKFPFFNKSEILSLKQKINTAFPTFDKNKNNTLDRSEAQSYIAYIQEQTLSLITSKMDSDGDGQITHSELLQYMQNLPSLEESLKVLNKITSNLQKNKDVPPSNPLFNQTSFSTNNHIFEE